MFMTVGRWWQEQKLVSRLAIMLIGAGFVMAVLSWGALRMLLLPAFSAAEMRVNDAQLQRTRVSLDALGQRLKGDALDYAVWDDAYRYMERQDPRFEAETLSPVAFQNMGVDMVAIVRMDREVMFSQVVDLAKGQAIPAEGRRFAEMLSRTQLFERFQRNETFLTYVRTSRGVYMIAGAWVRMSDGSGAVQGFLVKGELLQAGMLSDALQAATRLLPAPDAAMQAELSEGKGAYTRVGENHIQNAIALEDYRGTVIGAIIFETRRDISAVGRSAVSGAATVMMLNFILLVGIVGIAFNRIGVRRLARLSAEVAAFREARAGIDRRLAIGDDEIAALAREFDSLVDNLQDAEEQLRQRSYLQGMADSASGLLHNVRNALAPLRVALEKWLHEEQLPYRANLRKAFDAIEAPDCDPARQAELLRFIIAAGRKMLAQGDTRVVELGEARDAVDQIGMILSSHSDESMQASVDERIDLEGLVAREARQLSIRLAGLIDIVLPPSIPPVVGNHVQLGQVVTNLFVNAVESMQAAHVPRMRLEVGAAQDPRSGTVTLSVRDNGEGADPAVLASVFERGFSTRTHKTGGIGLHWCANAVRVMGGSLVLTSEGPGTGATATLTLRADEGAASSAAMLSDAA